MDGFMKIRKEIAEKLKIKEYLESNIEYHIQVLNKIKNELNKANLKLNKEAGTINPVKVYKSNNLHIKNEMAFLEKELEEVKFQ